MKLELSWNPSQSLSLSGDSGRFPSPSTWGQPRSTAQWGMDEIKEQVRKVHSLLGQAIEDDPSLLPLEEARHWPEESSITPKSIYDRVYPSEKTECRSDFSVERETLERHQEKWLNEMEVEGCLTHLEPLFKAIDPHPDRTARTKSTQGIFSAVDGLDWSRLVLYLGEDNLIQELKDTAEAEDEKMTKAMMNGSKRTSNRNKSWFGRLWSAVGGGSSVNSRY